MGKYKKESVRVWTKQMLFGQIGPWPMIHMVKVSESSEFLFMLDSCGRIQVINPNLSTTDSSSHQEIFTYRCLGKPIWFDLAMSF